jgi:hypothetical protein
MKSLGKGSKKFMFGLCAFWDNKGSVPAFGLAADLD